MHQVPLGEEGRRGRGGHGRGEEAASGGAHVLVILLLEKGKGHLTKEKNSNSNYNQILNSLTCDLDLALDPPPDLSLHDDGARGWWCPDEPDRR